MVLQRIDSRREEGSGALIDIYELRDLPDGDAVMDDTQIEAVLDGPLFRHAMERLGPSARASLVGSDSGVLQVRARADQNDGAELIPL